LSSMTRMRAIVLARCRYFLASGTWGARHSASGSGRSD
jgi:hypothetical protein